MIDCREIDMEQSLKKVLDGYKKFREKYASSDQSIMQHLSYHGQKPEIMVVSCCDSRVDPALIMQCDPGDLFVVRNIANIVPPYEKDSAYHGTSAALEFGIKHLKVKHLILLGHSQCGGIKALINKETSLDNDFIDRWVSIINLERSDECDVNDYAKTALKKSYKNCLTFPWIREAINSNTLKIHLWFFDIETCQIHTCNDTDGEYARLDTNP